MTSANLLTPSGRLVQGNLYKANTTDAEGKPLINKSGPSAGQPRVEYYFAIAIPKGAEAHWSQTQWGQEIVKVGAVDFPQAHQAPTFAWKVKDGDSTVPNRKGKRPCDSPGFARCWVLGFSSGYPPKIFREAGTVAFPDADGVKLGDWIQVAGTVAGNGSQSQPGVFLNHNMVNFNSFGERIVTGPDAATVGFSATVMGTAAPAAAAGFNPQAAFPVAPTSAPFPGVAAPAPVAVQPHTGFLAPAPVGAAMPVSPPLPVPGVPAAPPVHRMTAKAAGATRENFLVSGWTDALLVAHGYMEA